MAIDNKLIDQFINVTSKASLAASYLVGKKDKIAADKAAVDSMRTELNNMNIKGRVVIGEGELDEAPMLYIGERLGSNNGPALDIAVDPLEGTNFAANNLPGALSVIAVSEKNNLLNAPETYMQKIATSVKEKNVVDLDFSTKKNISNLCDYLNKFPENLYACIMDRPRHHETINELKQMKVNLKLITDGDVSGALLVTDQKYKIDIFLGIGGGPEGVLAAAALDAFDCSFQGRFLFNTKEDKIRANNMGIKDLTKKYELNEIVKGDSIFCATGITSGDLINGVKLIDGKYITETLITNKKHSINIIKKEEPIT